MNIVINTRNAGKEAIEILNQELQNGGEQIAKLEVRGKTLYIFTKAYLEAND